MRSSLQKRLAICLAVGLFTISAVVMNGCAGARIHGHYGKGTGKNTEPVPKQHQGKYEYKNKHKHKKGGPPSHAPAHGYRAKHKYRYYPDCSVYHDTDRDLYFYLKGDNWEIGASLPSNLRVRLGGSVSLEMDTDKPYTLYAEHRTKYPPGKSKKKHKKVSKKK